MDRSLFEKILRICNVLNIITDKGTVDINKLEKFIENIESFESDLNKFLNFNKTNQFNNVQVAVNKDGKLGLVRRVATNTVDNQVEWGQVDVLYDNGSCGWVKMSEVAPFTQASITLFGKKE